MQVFLSHRLRKAKLPESEGQLLAAFGPQAEESRTSPKRIRRRSPCDSRRPASTSNETRFAKNTSGTPCGRVGIESIAVPTTRATFLHSLDTCDMSASS